MVSPVNSDPSNRPQELGTQGELPDMPKIPSRTTEDIARFAHKIGEVAASKTPVKATMSDTAAQVREEALTEGSGFSTSLARQMTGQEDPPYSPPKPVLVVKPPKRPHYSRRGGRSYPEKSGRDVSREIAEASPGSGLSQEEQMRVNEDGGRLWRVALQEALGQKQISAEQTPAQLWIAPAQVSEDMRILGSDSRAGFRPSTDGERAAAIRLLERLNPDPGGPNGVDAYLARQHRFIKMNKHNIKLSEIERQAQADDAVCKEITKYGDYAHDHAQKLASVRVLSSVLEPRGETEKVGDLLRMQLPDAGSTKRGMLALVQHMALREVAAYGRSSIGVSPFRNLGINFDELAIRIGSVDVDGHSKRDQVLRYVQDSLDTMTVADAKKIALPTAKFQWNGVGFWSGVLESINGRYAQTAKEALESVWKI